MTITVQQVTLGSHPASAGTLVGSQAIAAPSTWTRLTTLGSVLRGAKIIASSDAEPFRISIIDPRESTNPSGPTPPPNDNGVLIPTFGATAKAFEQQVPPNAAVWVKQA